MSIYQLGLYLLSQPPEPEPVGVGVGVGVGVSVGAPPIPLKKRQTLCRASEAPSLEEDLSPGRPVPRPRTGTIIKTSESIGELPPLPPKPTSSSIPLLPPKPKPGKPANGVCYTC